ncbi:hypothetical protein I601_1003 [Nocardioides dokdonensis FR1436]|uniref:SHD domain-containing protein n=1 Tax=Nocardioides dokdonensis FR1436 TaxID=1300347 RepID=A0A1A9GJ04_9ACTN|nr:hypothetical protein [Nocardioides dokdonensis]ANH37445.1 hypothetical protein I601_1003 [Nocardioides dokdonensis FR1436]
MRRYLINDEPLEGPHGIRLRLRPIRTARPIPPDDEDYFVDSVMLQCQVWGGAATPLIPVTSEGYVHPLYAGGLRGADIDGLVGLNLQDFDPGRPEPVEVPPCPAPWWGLQLAPVTIAKPQGERKSVVSCAVLTDDDPWRGIYAACLGRLPSSLDPVILHQGRYREDLTFEDLIDLIPEEVTGSAADLLERLHPSRTVASPRAASMSRLAYGRMPATGIRTRSHSSPIPRGRYWAGDAGPNILVVCTPGNVNDLALLWNLRASHGDSYGVPVGVLADSFTPDLVQQLVRSELVARQGFGAHALYVTSTSLNVTELAAQWREARTGTTQWPRDDEPVAFIEACHLVDIGPAPARHRQEVTTWTQGRTSVVPILPEDRTALSWSGANDLELRIDVDVIDAPFPRHPSVRTGLFTDFFAGTATHNATGTHASPAVVEWPSTMLTLRVIAQRHDLTVEPSEPGVACMTLLNALEGVHELAYLVHGPLLKLFDELAARTGTAWAKAFNRSGQPVATEVAPTIDDLPDVPFDKFKAALGVKTGPARAWMAWAERRRLVVKGFPLQCERCAARQWVPVSGYRPPIVCVGCAQVMEHPFPKEQITFTYRLGEVLRRVYEHDAMGHLLTLRYLSFLLEGGFEPGFIGVHPGLNFTPRGLATRLGEADMLLFERDGSCVPAEVKRSFGGATEDEVRKLTTLSDALESPWEVLAVTRYAKDAPEGWIDSMRIRRTDTEAGQLISAASKPAGSARPSSLRPRVVLTHEQLLDPSPIWEMGANPFEVTPMDQAGIVEREKRFAHTCESLASTRNVSMLEESMLYEPKRDET